MKIYCTPKGNEEKIKCDLKVILFSKASNPTEGSIGEGIKKIIQKDNLRPSLKAWDILAIALSVSAADYAGHRKKSPDGWTREFDLTIAVNKISFWNNQLKTLTHLLSFLTSDKWRIKFVGGGYVPNPLLAYGETVLKNDSVALLSGGLDSFIGLIDMVHAGLLPVAVSQLVLGDAAKQREITQLFSKKINHFQFNHNVSVPDPESPPSQRARSFLFLAYGILIASCLRKYKDGGNVKLYMSENGYISLNPPLTGIRIGSLSTRTTNPIYLNLFQKLINEAGLRISIVNPYHDKTKGQMLKECKNQSILKSYAHKTTSCGKYKVHGHIHCGRCVPCLIRRSAFKAWGFKDNTSYKYNDLSIDNEDHAQYDDVRSACMAILSVKENGIKSWLGASLNKALLGDTGSYEATINNGLKELEDLLAEFKLI